MKFEMMRQYDWAFGIGIDSECIGFVFWKWKVTLHWGEQ